MAITYGAQGTGGNGTTSCDPTYPSGINANTSALFAIVCGRSSVADTAITGPAGWTSVGQLEGGTGTFGVDTGTRRVAFFRKDTVTGSETGSETFSFAAGDSTSVLTAAIFRIEKTSGHSLYAQFASGADSSNDTSFSAASSSSIQFLANDLLLVGVAQNVDTGTSSSHAVSATGVTFGSITSRIDIAVTTGNDVRRILHTVPVTAGSTAAPTFSYTASEAASGSTAFLLLREGSGVGVPASLPHLTLVLPRHLTLTAEQGTYSVSGQDAALGKFTFYPAPLPHLSLIMGRGIYSLNAEYGTYSITGQAAGSVRHYVIDGARGSYAVNGKAASLTPLQGGRAGHHAPLPHLGLMLAPSVTEFTLTANTGIYSILGSDALADHEVDAEYTTYSITGQDATLLKTTILTAESGTYSVSGQDVGFTIGSTNHVMPADYGTYSITGQNASLTATRKLSVEFGFYGLGGQAADLIYGPRFHYTLNPEGGVYTVSGTDIPLGRYLYAETGVYTVTGPDIPPFPVPQKDAGIPARRTAKRRYKVVIDGEEFDVSSPQEAEALLAKAREAAEETAKQTLERALKAEKRPVRKVVADARKSLVTPTIVADEELTAQAQELAKAIEQIYGTTLQNVEIAVRLRDKEEDDEEDIIGMLL